MYLHLLPVCVYVFREIVKREPSMHTHNVSVTFVYILPEIITKDLGLSAASCLLIENTKNTQQSTIGVTTNSLIGKVICSSLFGFGSLSFS